MDKMMKMINIKILRTMGKEKELVTIVKCRQLQYLGHILRNKCRYDLQKRILQGKINYKKSPGRKKTIIASHPQNMV